MEESSKSTDGCDLDGRFFFYSCSTHTHKHTHRTFTKRSSDNTDRYSFCKVQPWLKRGVTAFLSFHFTVLASVQGHYTSIPTTAFPRVFHHSALCCVWKKYSTAWFISAAQPCKIYLIHTPTAIPVYLTELWQHLNISPRTFYRPHKDKPKSQRKGFKRLR